jgi:hypothetical protein
MALFFLALCEFYRQIGSIGALRSETMKCFPSPLAGVSTLPNRVTKAIDITGRAGAVSESSQRSAAVDTAVHIIRSTAPAHLLCSMVGGFACMEGNTTQRYSPMLLTYIHSHCGAFCARGFKKSPANIRTRTHQTYWRLIRVLTQGQTILLVCYATLWERPNQRCSLPPCCSGVPNQTPLTNKRQGDGRQWASAASWGKLPGCLAPSRERQWHSFSSNR